MPLNRETHPRNPPRSPRPPRDRSQADARARAKEISSLWLDVYTSALEVFLSAREPATEPAIHQCVDDARLAADKAVDVYEERWRGVDA